MWHNPVVGRLVKVAFGLLILIVLGSAGYVCLEGWPFHDGFFMTVITLSTVGYGETHELSPAGRWFTAALIFLCIVGMTIWTATLTSFVVEADLSGSWLRRRMMNMISKLKDHTIVCGSGMMAQAVVERLMRRRLPVVVVDEDANKVQAMKRRFPRLLTVEGAGTNELILAQANILSAKTVVAAMESEVDNLLISITCRDMGQDIAIFARSNDVSIANRMRKAGVSEVLSPCQLCADKVADLIPS